MNYLLSAAIALVVSFGGWFGFQQTSQNFGNMGTVTIFIDS